VVRHSTARWAAIALVSAAKCKAISHRDHFTGKTVLKKGRLFAGKSEVAVDQRCRPSAPGGK